MTRKLLTTAMLASFLGFVLADSALAQGAIQPGTEFPAAPMSKGGISLSAPSQVLPATPAPPPPEAAPAPVPVHKKRRRRHGSSTS